MKESRVHILRPSCLDIGGCQAGGVLQMAVVAHAHGMEQSVVRQRDEMRGASSAEDLERENHNRFFFKSTYKFEDAT